MSLRSIAELLDTTGLEHQKTPTRALVVVNSAPRAFAGVAVLHADFYVRHPARVVVFAPDATVVPSRLVDEHLSEPRASDGKRRWTFHLQFFCDCPPKSAIAYGAVFAEGTPIAADWEARRAAGMLPALETTCHPGIYPNPVALPERGQTKE